MDVSIGVHGLLTSFPAELDVYSNLNDSGPRNAADALMANGYGIFGQPGE